MYIVQKTESVGSATALTQYPLIQHSIEKRFIQIFIPSCLLTRLYSTLDHYLVQRNTKRSTSSGFDSIYSGGKLTRMTQKP